MPPKAANASQRKGPAFKPPRPVKSNGPSTNTTTKRAPAKTAAPTSRNNSINLPTLISSSEDELDAEDEPSASDGDEEMDDAPEISKRSIALQPTREPIPRDLLARLLYEGFDDKSIKINQGALDLFGRYMDTFVREAMARAEVETREKGDHDGFLQVEDLEKLAPQLILDF